MKNILFSFDKMSENDRNIKTIKSKFLKLGVSIIDVAQSGVKRSNGISFKELTFTLSDSQSVAIRVKQTGDVYQVLLNKKVLPIKDQDDHESAIKEIAAKVDQGRSAFQKKLAATKITIPSGIKSTVPQTEAALTEKRDALKDAISDADAQIEDLQQKIEAGRLPAAKEEKQDASMSVLAQEDNIPLHRASNVFHQEIDYVRLNNHRPDEKWLTSVAKAFNDYDAQLSLAKGNKSWFENHFSEFKGYLSLIIDRSEDKSFIQSVINKVGNSTPAGMFLESFRPKDDYKANLESKAEEGALDAADKGEFLTEEEAERAEEEANREDNKKAEEAAERAEDRLEKENGDDDEEDHDD